MSGAYYNEFDPFAAQWLRNLIAGGHLPAGDVDDRSIVDVRPDDLTGYTQVHFFAGIGGWGHALRLAGWPDDRPIWTGSCPCQPFSNAGKGGGTDDPRHLWPHFFRLIAAVRPPVVMGEQVAGSAGYGWLDGVRADLAREGYASRGVDIPACAVDAPHIRNRLYWVAVANAAEGRQGPHYGVRAGDHLRGDAGEGRGPHGGEPLANADRAGPSAHGRDAGEVCGLSAAQRRPEDDTSVPGREHGEAVHLVADADRGGRDGRPEDPERGEVGRAAAERPDARGGQSFGDAEGVRRGEGRPQHELHVGRGSATPGADARREQLWGDCVNEGLEGHGSGGSPQGRQASDRPASPPNVSPTFWYGADPLLCHDGKTRRTQRGVPLLVDGVRGRVAAGVALGQPDHPQADRPLNRIGVWKGAGNAIVPQEAEQVIRAYMDIAP